jgi:hypothetical protein
MSEPQNQGTGVGGSKTNHNGIAFEQKTDSNRVLIFHYICVYMV